MTQNIKDRNYFKVANAVKSQNIQKLIKYIDQDIVNFNLSYGPYGTILDYAIELGNHEMLGIVYLSIMKSQNFENITHHPKKLNLYFIQIIESFEQADLITQGTYESTIAIMLDLNLIDFKQHVHNLIFNSNYKVLDVALSRFSPYIFKGLIDYLLKNNLNEQDIMKLISLDIPVKKILFDPDSSIEFLHLISSQISPQCLIANLAEQFNMDKNHLENLVIKQLNNKEGYDDCIAPEFIANNVP